MGKRKRPIYVMTIQVIAVVPGDTYSLEMTETRPGHPGRLVMVEDLGPFPLTGPQMSAWATAFEEAITYATTDAVALDVSSML